jgi:hypothetical protein
MRVENYGEKRDRLHFDCPRRPGHECSVLLKPWPIQGAPTWEWDGNAEAPTLNPSINCGACGWHGYIRAGSCVE